MSRRRLRSDVQPSVRTHRAPVCSDVISAAAVHFSLPKESPEDDGEAVLPCSQKCDEVTAWCTDLYRQAVITTPAYIGW